MKGFKNKQQQKEILECLTRYRDIIDWQSKLKAWKDGIHSMEKMIKLHIGSIEEKSMVIQFRELHHQISGKLRRKLERLEEEIDLQFEEVKKVIQSEIPSERTLSKTIHLQFYKRVNLLEEEYSELKNNLYERLGQSLKRKRRRSEAA